MKWIDLWPGALYVQNRESRLNRTECSSKFVRIEYFQFKLSLAVLLPFAVATAYLNFARMAKHKYIYFSVHGVFFSLSTFIIISLQSMVAESERSATLLTPFCLTEPKSFRLGQIRSCVCAREYGMCVCFR